jgi:hypothetical protein
MQLQALIPPIVPTGLPGFGGYEPVMGGEFVVGETQPAITQRERTTMVKKLICLTMEYHDAE